jgi:CRP/FNR family transcriptional regulator, cyclic AMP receptor protein
MSSPTHEEKRQIFQRHDLFGMLSANEIDSLISFSRIESYTAGREIFAKGEPGQSLMAVLRGSVKISLPSADGKEVVITIFNSGDIFGEIGVLDGGERSADATAMDHCDLLVLDRRDLMPIFTRRADICLVLLKMLCQRLRKTTEQVEDVVFRHLESRMAKALLHHAEKTNRPGLAGPSIEFHVPQRVLGNIASGSRESVSKHLQDWRRRGIIDLAKGSIIIRDAQALERLI